MKIKVNENFSNIADSYLFSDINKKIKAYKEKNPNADVIRLGIGDVTLPLSSVVIDALTKASLEMGNKDTFRGYPPEYGYDFLKEAILNYYKRFDVNLSMDSIFASDGAKSDLGNIVDILGDNDVYIPNPVYPVYLDSNIMSGRRVHFINGSKENNFLPMPNVNYKTGVYYLCSPNNPCGAVYNYEQLKEWVKFAKFTGSLIIFDSAYEAFIKDRNLPHSIYEIEGAKECAIEICSFSKQAGFTGLRCGYTIVPEELMCGDYSINKLWKRRQATKFNGVSYPVQRAAEAALSDTGIKECQKNIEYYMENAHALSKLFDEKGIYYTGGKSSPYIWFKCPNNMDSWSFFEFLLKEANVVGTPGVGFGTQGEGYFRITSFGTHEKTKEAIERLRKIL
ncbi:MAG: LL-diaminopimelate aminotransferase [Acholeplasmatales bacterium]|nr:LL-diaminopimelate aminotransferase [Acholeplasmatales bacterium]